MLFDTVSFQNVHSSGASSGATQTVSVKKPLSEVEEKRLSQQVKMVRNAAAFVGGLTFTTGLVLLAVFGAELNSTLRLEICGGMLGAAVLTGVAVKWHWKVQPLC